MLGHNKISIINVLRTNSQHHHIEKQVLGLPHRDSL